MTSGRQRPRTRGASEAERNAAEQSGLDGGAGPGSGPPGDPPDETAAPAFVARYGTHYREGAGLFRAVNFQRYQRRPGDPLYRTLRVYEADPVTSGYTGRTAALPVAYEPLDGWPDASVIRVEPEPEAVRSRLYLQSSDIAGLDDIRVALQQGFAPSVTDPRFRAQMVYAIASDVIASFAMALGREPAWGFEGPRITLVTNCPNEANAWYEADKGRIVFGSFPAAAGAGVGIMPGKTIYTCLSRDIVAHEMTHALLDGLRARFKVATNPEVPAFHEAFADLVAILQRFSVRDSVETAIRESGGDLRTAALLTVIAEEFGQARGTNGPLRQIRIGKPQSLAEAAAEEHERGLVLVSAVIEAFHGVYLRRSLPIRELLAGRPVPGPMPDQAVQLLTDCAMGLASSFLSLLIRAIDYCPPVDLYLGEFLRALITADRDLVEDDRYRYREELIAAFARRRIFPPNVEDFSEDALHWRPPNRTIPAVPGLALAAIALPSDPGCAPSREEIRRQAGALADRITDPRFMGEFGLVPPGKGELPAIESIRVVRRVGPDRQVQVGLVCEVTQEITHPFRGIGGATILIDGAGRFRFIIGKRTDQAERARTWAATRAGPGTEDPHKTRFHRVAGVRAGAEAGKGA